MKRISRHAAAVVTILLITLGLGLYLAGHDSMTTDEGVHIGSAYLALTRHDFRFDSEHPFLFKTLTALPLLPLHLNLPKDDLKDWNAALPSYYDSWRQSRNWSDEWFYQSGNNADLMIFLARIPAVLMFTLTVWLVYWIGRQWFGKRVALWAMIFTAANPLLIGHGHLANTDIPLVPAFLLAIYTMWRYGEKPTLKNALWFGLACLVAMLSKFSGLILVPIFLLYVLVLAVRRRMRPGQAWGQVGAAALVVYIGIWVAYLFQSHYYPGAPYIPTTLERLQTFLGKHGITLAQFSTVMAHIIPMDYFKAAFLQADNVDIGRGSYLFSHEAAGGVWYYFPSLYLLKTPLINLALLVAGAWITFKTKLRHSAHLAMGVAILVYVIIAMSAKLNLGIRHILPLFPLLSIYMALGAVAILDHVGRRWLAPLIGLLAIAPPVMWFPNYINYNNILIGPSSDAWRFYNDSNLDWGQDMKEVASTVQNLYPGQMVFFNPSWSPYALSYYGVQSRPYNPEDPPHDGIAIIGATELSDPSYAHFQNMKPASSISNTTFIYVLR